MQRLEVSGAVRPIYGSLGVKRLIKQPQGFKRLIAAPGTKRRRPQLTANWNSNKRCAACRQAKRSEFRVMFKVI